MSASWKLTAFGPKEAIEAALVRHERMHDWDAEIVLTAFEVDVDRPAGWRLDAYLPRKPRAEDRKAVAALFPGETPEFFLETLPEEDWVTTSQHGVQPIQAGRFYIHTPDYPPSADPALRSFAIPASQAFGTGQHATTAGCLEMLTAMKRRGVLARRIADIGTGTGLLAFAAMELWPNAEATASDIDPICVPVIERNMEANGIRAGSRRGELTVVQAEGMDSALLQARAPYDLLIANILAAPLIDLAPDFAEVVPGGGSVVLAGLLETQESAVRSAYLAAGFRLAARLVEGEWSILWLRRRRIGWAAR